MLIIAGTTLCSYNSKAISFDNAKFAESRQALFWIPSCEICFKIETSDTTTPDWAIWNRIHLNS